MTGIYYAAVEDDPLTSGKGSRVFAYKQAGTIKGDDGKYRRLAFIGDEAYCPACNSTGTITYGAGVSDRKRMIDFVNGGRRQAVGGDIVLCKCDAPPRIIAVYGRKWMIHDRGEEKPASVAIAPAEGLTYDEQFTLTDAAGSALADTWYTVRLPSGELLHGVTDSSGKTARYATDGAHRLALYLGHRET
ncbi:hypothetical protein FAZ95_08050 [Trinickia violacea]|uniref:PAAR domain-containing protein n=1 Tax=Trinickia violacea TaxID=2571746 RepID=A0A4P8IQG0_9BURK|nr:hypothetical protein [Trinickia violacea]QCP49134.1 hypothetical protein FAZ95_08050 [Trinickia violacea]